MMTAGYSSIPEMNDSGNQSILSVILTVIISTITGIWLYKKLTNTEQYESLPE